MGTVQTCRKNTMKVLFVFALAFAASQALHLDAEWEAFKVKYGKGFLSATHHDERKSIFAANLERIEKHNAEHLEGKHSYWLGVNQFADLTNDEFVDLHTGFAAVPTSLETADLSHIAAPSSYDWRDKGAVTPVKNQGQCGSCWAQTTTEVVESYVQINTGVLPILSTQQVTSCTPNPLHCGGTGGCFGSVCQLGYNYIQLFGITEEETYPYISGTTMQTEECMYDITGTAPVAGITGYDTLPRNNQEAVMEHLANVGPLGFAADASIWHRYSHGVFDGCPYEENISINHGIQLVGYGTNEEEGDYWIVRNSWGEGYGENGYIRLKREKEARRGTDSTPMDGIACVGGQGNA